MVKAKPTLSMGGYSTWGIRRTLQEALNVARYSPWTAIKWMEEAKDFIDIHSPFYEQYDDTARKINALWKSYEKYHWYDAQDFWKKGTVKHQAQTIKLFSEEYDDYEPFDSRSFWKI